MRGLLLRGREERREEGGDRRCEEGVGEREGIWLIGLRAMDARGHIPSKRLTHGFGFSAGKWGMGRRSAAKSQGNVRREF